jgi:hypothetical protein
MEQELKPPCVKVTYYRSDGSTETILTADKHIIAIEGDPAFVRGGMEILAQACEKYFAADNPGPRWLKQQTSAS